MKLQVKFHHRFAKPRSSGAFDGNQIAETTYLGRHLGTKNPFVFGYPYSVLSKMRCPRGAAIPATRLFVLPAQSGSARIDGPMCPGEVHDADDLVKPDLAQKWQTVQMHLDVGYHQVPPNPIQDPSDGIGFVTCVIRRYCMYFC